MILFNENKRNDLMKFLYMLSMAAILEATSCTHESKVIESTYPDGSPKRICIYHGKDASRELIREITYYPDRKIQMQGEYTANERDGRWVYFYQNGNLWSEGFFRKGKSDGKRTTYFENGKVCYEGYYKEDVRVGVWKFYDDKGKLLKSVDYTKAPGNFRTP